MAKDPRAYVFPSLRYVDTVVLDDCYTNDRAGYTIYTLRNSVSAEA